MNALNFSTGVKTFAVNDGAAEISYNPTDPIFAERVYDAFLSLAEKLLSYQCRTMAETFILPQEDFFNSLSRRRGNRHFRSSR